MTLLVHSHAVGSTATPLIEDTIGRHFEARARRFPDRDALVSRHQGKRLSYRELHVQSSQLASAATSEPACKGPVGEGAKRPM